MKYSKIQFILLFVISALCWNNVFGQTTDDTFCNSYLIQSNQLDTNVVEFSIYNSTDFGPYYPDVDMWYILELELPLGDSVSVILDLNQTPPNLPPLTLCVDYTVDGNACTLCVILPSIEANCDYEIALESYGLEFWGSIYSPSGQNYAFPNDITWILEGGGGVIGTGPHLNYIFDEEGTYLVCAEYEDALTECAGVLCDSVVIYGVNEPCDYELDIAQDSFGIAAILMDSYGNFPSSVTWILENGGGVIGNGPFLDYQFSEPGEYVICAEYFDDSTGCSGVLCQNIITIGTNEPCDYNLDISQDGSYIFGILSDNYQNYPSSVTWFLENNSDFIGYEYLINYQFDEPGEYTICAEYFDEPTGCSGVLCEDIIITVDDTGTCSDFDFDYVAQGNWAYFEVFYPDIYEVYEDSIVWTVDGLIVGYGNSVDYSFPVANGTFIVCANVQGINLQTGEWCITEICHEVTIGCPPISIASAMVNDSVATFELEAATDPFFLQDITWYVNTYEEGQGDTFTYFFPESGSYSICVIASMVDAQGNWACITESCIQVEVEQENDNCNAYFEWQENSSPDSTLYAVGFSNLSTGNTHAQWSFGDGNMDDATEDSFVHFYENIGVYNVCLTVWDVNTGCQNEHCELVFISGTPTTSECENTDCVFPGDADRNMIVDNYDVLPIGLHFGQTGPTRSDATIAWYGQPATDWQSFTIDSLDLKHVDCNGDGEIFFDDIDAIEQNYNRTHNGVTANRMDGAPGLHLEFDLDTIYSTPDTGNIIINADIIMGTSDLPVEEIYGVAFSIAYPADLVDSSSVMADYFIDSWIGDAATTLQLEKNVVSQSVVDFAYSRTDQQNISGFGQIGSVSFVMTDNIIGKLSSMIELNFPITNVRAILNTGEEVIVMGGENAVTVNINDTATDTNTPDLSQHINIFPNPTSNTINITTNDLQAQTLALYNTVGQQVLARQVISTNTQIDVSQLPSGMYLLSIQTDKGLYNEKIIVE